MPPFGTPANAGGRAEDQSASRPSSAPKPKVFLVFPPGLARAWAAIGVLEAFEAAKTQVTGVAGLEAGALIAAAYARSGSVSRLKWDLLTLPAELFHRKPRFGIRWLERPVEVAPLAKTLTRLFGDGQVESQRLKLLIAGRQVHSEGLVAERVLESFWNPVLFDPADRDWAGDSFDPRDAWSSLLSGLMAQAAPGATEGMDLWIFDWIDPSPGPRVATQESRYAHVVKDVMETLEQGDSLLERLQGRPLRVRRVRIPLLGVGYLDFDRRSDAVFQGKTVTQQALLATDSNSSEGSVRSPQ